MPQLKPKKEHKAIFGLGLSALILVSCLITGHFAADSREMIYGAGILVISLILWSTEALPMSITTMLMICLLAITGIMSFHEAIANIGVNTSLFIMASSGITIAVGSSCIPRSLTWAIVSKANRNSKLMVVGIGFLIAVCSAFMSSLATCALFNSILLPMLVENHHEAGKSNLGKCIMIAIPACAGIGGFMSPAGTPANILLLDILADNGISVNFGEWCLIGFPIGVIAAVVFLISLVLIYPPEKLCSPETAMQSNPKFNADDKKTILIVGTIIVLWFASGWVSSLNPTMIAVIGLAFMFMPGVSLLNWKKFSEGVNWDLVLTMGTVSVLMTGIAKTGLMSQLSSGIVSFTVQIPAILALIMLSISICIIRSFVPTTTAVVALLAPMLIETSVSLNNSILSLLMILAFWTASALLIVYTEPIYLITYNNRYYKGRDLLRAGIIPCLIMSVVTAVAVPWISSFIKIV